MTKQLPKRHREIYAPADSPNPAPTPQAIHLWHEINDLAATRNANEVACHLNMRTEHLIYHCRKLSVLFNKPFPHFTPHERLQVKKDGGVRLGAEHCAAIRAYPGAVLKVDVYPDYMIVRRVATAGRKTG